MADRFCVGCGAPLRSGVRVCPRCGRVAVSARPASAPIRQTNGSAQTSPKYRTRSEQTKHLNVKRSDIKRSEVKRRRRTKTALSGLKKGVRILARTVIVAVLLIVVYIGVFLIQTTRVKLSSYDFESNMLMSSDNYGQAFDSYFEEGSWSVNPLTGKVVYEGTSKHSENIKITFTVRFKVTLEAIVVDNVEVDEEYYDTKMMAMYI